MLFSLPRDVLFLVLDCLSTKQDRLAALLTCKQLFTAGVCCWYERWQQWDGEDEETLLELCHKRCFRLLWNALDGGDRLHHLSPKTKLALLFSAVQGRSGASVVVKQLLVHVKPGEFSEPALTHDLFQSVSGQLDWYYVKSPKICRKDGILLAAVRGGCVDAEFLAYVSGTLYQRCEVCRSSRKS